jgi:hypothetical protein
MRRLMVAAGLTALCGLGGCTSTNLPLCQYWSDAIIGKDMDPSQVPMVPANPYWTGARAAAPGDPCYGQPPPSAVHG